jgi:hypothetical protein
MAPEAGRHTQAPELLFVHKFAHSASLSHSQREEKRSIATHVQSWRKKQKLKTAAAGQVKFQHHLRAKSQSVDGTSSPDADDGTRADPVQLLVPEAAVSRITLNATHPRALTVKASGHSIDPFDTSSTKFDEQTYILIQYYLKVVYPSRFHAETRSQSPQKHQFHLAENEVIRDCLENELHMVTLLTSTASRMQHMEGTPLKQGTDIYMQRALRALRNYVAESPVASTQLVFDMFHLFTAEAYRFNNAAANVHLKAAKMIIEQMGGQATLQRAHPHLIETLVIGDLFVAAEDLAAPVFECTFDPGFGTAKHLGLTTGKFRTQMGLRLLNPVQSAIVNSQTYQVVKEVIECVKVAVVTSALQEPPSEALRWLHLRNLSIRHHLLCMTSDDPRTTALHTALQMWILFAFTRMGPVRTTKVMAPKLRDMLLKTDWQSWVSHEDIYAWILSIGAMAARETLHENWFVDQILRLCIIEDLASLDELRKLAEQFFYLDNIQSIWLERLARQLSLARSSSMNSVSVV